MNQRSIYDTILDNIENGRLKEDFSVCAEFPARNPLTAGGPGAQVNYADGAVDGIILYHIGALDLGGIGEAKLIRAVNLCSERMPEQADRCFAELGAKAGAVSAIDRLHDCIYSHRMRINPANLYNSAADIIFNSRNIESVKFAMGIIETMVKVDEQVREAIRTLALSDEFALFAIWDMLQWENGNDETFEVAKKLSGWGRIHAVKELEATRPEIKKWLFDEGIENGVMPDYSAFQVWTKAGVGEILKGDVTADGFRKIGRILDALISEEPVPGISEIENSEEAVGNFLAHAREFELDAEEYEYIFRLSKWAAREDNGFYGLAAECGDLLTTEECREAVIKAVANGKGLQMAEELGIDYADSFLKCLEENFDRQYYNVSYLTRLPDYLEPVLGIFRQNLDLPNMRAEPTNDLGFNMKNEKYLQLEKIVWELEDYPCEGEDLVIACLWSPGTRTRHTALRVLTGWTRALQKPLEEISPAAFEELKALFEKEVDRELKKEIKNLLHGVIPEPGNDGAED